MKTPQNIVASKSANFFIPILLKGLLDAVTRPSHLPPAWFKRMIKNIYRDAGYVNVKISAGR
jgi:uncharacterized membrane protein